MVDPRRLWLDAVAALRADSLLWRRALMAGIEHGPEPFLRYSPPLFGLAFAAALPPLREIVRANLRLVHGPRSPLVEARDIARVFTTYASSLTEAIQVAAQRGTIERHHTGTEHYFASAEGGRGVIMATAHTAGWEVAGHVLSGVHHGEVVVVMQRERDDRARELSDSFREKAGVKVVHLAGDSMDALTLLSHLRRGAALAMQFDRVMPGARVREGRLFGEKWPVPEGLLRLAAASGAPILPVLTSRLGHLAYKAEVSAPIRLPRRPTEAELDAAAQAVLDAFASFLRQHATQWFHFVPRGA